MENRVHNFSAGPAVLPVEVLKEVQKDLLNYQGKGMSVMEMSHRSKDYQAIFDETKASINRVFGLKDNFEILFLGGGATTQFLMTALNFCPDDKVANYINTGTWATNAFKEAKKAGKNAHLAASSEDKGFNYIPKAFNLSDNPAYLHITSNNTIAGTQYHKYPELPADVPLFCDMSSDIMSKPIDVNKFAVIYAGAQKNIGPAGATLVLIRKDMVEKIAAGLPTMLSYSTHISKDSMHNTPPTFIIYIIGLVMKWIESKGGLEAIEIINKEKAAYIYDTIDESNGYYVGTVAKEDRSLMNITFRLPSEELEAQFIKEAAAKGFSGLKGHRSVGGCRASTYNALPIEATKQLAEFMKEFMKNNRS